MNVVGGSRALYGLFLPVGMVIAVARGRRSRRRRERGAAHPMSAARSATAVTPRRLRRRQLQALIIGGTDVGGYDLRRARLTGLVLPGVDLSGMDMTRASFRKSNLAGADLRHTGADLRGANLTACRQMGMVNLRGARFDRSTQWPGGINLINSGAIRER